MSWRIITSRIGIPPQTCHIIIITEMLLDDSIKQVRPIKMAEMRRPTFGMQFTKLAVTQSRNDGIGEFFQLSVLTVRRDKRQRMSSILTETDNVHDAHAYSHL